MAKRYTGTPGNDILPPQGSPAGADTLLGGKGNDTYYAAAGDKVIEKPNEGLDGVVAAISYVLPANVENLRLAGTAKLNGAGNGADNLILGNEQANRLDGKGGADTLLGNGGNDLLRVADLDFAKLDGGAGFDA
ncbi:MAG: hypothetical protein EPN21_02535, partial [Methylococcaceae bacterium]